ncbi:hypothetical protein AB4Z25_13875 [Rhizobium sp. RAF36]|uniref:hypothetical protein n=1 Tax=Rhizobium sp. RAF36 TaxID=3233055 RepID=UPI003F9867F8
MQKAHSLIKKSSSHLVAWINHGRRFAAAAGVLSHENGSALIAPSLSEALATGNVDCAGVAKDAMEGRYLVGFDHYRDDDFAAERSIHSSAVVYRGSIATVWYYSRAVRVAAGFHKNIGAV